MNDYIIKSCVIELMDIDREIYQLTDELKSLLESKTHITGDIEINIDFGLADIILDLMGIPEDNTFLYEEQIMNMTSDKDWPEDCYCRDWAYWILSEDGTSEDRYNKIKELHNA